MKLDDLAYRLYDAHCSYENRETGKWEHVTNVQNYWRGIAMRAADTLGVKLEPNVDPRYEAALKVLVGLHFTGSHDVIARAIVAAIDAAKPT